MKTAITVDIRQSGTDLTVTLIGKTDNGNGLYKIGNRKKEFYFSLSRDDEQEYINNSIIRGDFLPSYSHNFYLVPITQDIYEKSLLTMEEFERNAERNFNS